MLSAAVAAAADAAVAADAEMLLEDTGASKQQPQWRQQQ